MRFFNDRAGLPLLLAFAVLPLGCKHKPQVLPPKPVVVPGDMLRFAGKANDKGSGKVTVRVEDSNVGAKKPKVSAFQFGEEHTIAEVRPDGSMHITGAFVDVEALGDSPREKKEGEVVARALQEVKIAYDIDARGNVTNFAAPLSDDQYDAKVVQRTKLIAQWVYGADRGPLFDPGPIELGKGWKIRAEVPIKQGDTTIGNKNWDIDYTYTKKEKGTASIELNGKVSGEAQGTQLSGEVKGEVRLNLGAGRLVYQDIDSNSAFRAGGSDKGGHLVHVHVTWEANPDAPAPAADSSGVMN
jgi:hypothetical protein